MQIDSVFAATMLSVILGNMVTVVFLVGASRLDRGQTDLRSFAMLFGACAVILIVVVAFSEARSGTQRVDSRGQSGKAQASESVFDTPAR